MEKIVTLAKIFSDPNRVKIAALLQREGGVCVCEICDTLSLSQPLVSRHLKQMRQAGIVTAEHSGKWMVYALNDKENEILLCWKDAFQKVLSGLPPLVACSSYRGQSD